MSKVSVATDASSGVARSAMHTLRAPVAPSRAPSLRSGARGGRGVRPYINCRDSHHMNESSREICS
jgi:hypothetical protein